MLDPLDERRLAQGLRDGNTLAWQTLYDAFAERVWRGVARLLGPNSTDVADVVQETMMAAARSATKFDPERGSLWLWLWGIARNQTALHFRKQQRRLRLIHSESGLTLDNVLRWLEGHEPSPPSALASAEMVALVRATLIELPDDYAFLLTSRYLDGESVADIAARENSTEVAIRSKLARARQAFRAAFREPAQEATDRSAESPHASS